MSGFVLPGGNEIPLISRILAVCSTYDTITARESYRGSAMAPEEAMTELRNAARNGQLDGELVERFIAVLEREGATFGQEADFEAQFEFERRVRKMADPRSTDLAPGPGRARLRHLGRRPRASREADEAARTS